MEDPKLKQIIDRNMALAGALGVRGTPAFVVGKQFVPGRRSTPSSLKRADRRRAARASATPSR